MFRTWWQKVFTFPRTRLARRRGYRPPARLLGRTTRLSMTALEDRVTPAIVSYNAGLPQLVFTADAGEADNVTVSGPAAGTLRIQVGNGDAIVLAGDAVGNGSFVLSQTV